MDRAIILDFSDGTILILPIPEDIAESEQCKYVECHPCYNSNCMQYMIVGESAEVFEVSTEQYAHKENGMVCYEDTPIFTKVGEL